jgi:glyoxylase-like metal-dependent hydrolase (beta-lactamase superfamily II)
MTGKPIIHAFFDEPTNTVSYIVVDPATKEAAFVDPVLDYDPGASEVDTRSVEAMLRFAEEQGYHVSWTLETHAHADHLSGSPYVKAKTGAKIGIGEHIKDVQRIFRPVFDATDLKTDGSDFDHLFKDGERFKIGELDAEVLYTPGHTPADITYKIEDAAFVGDTLFMPDYGTARADFPGGDAHQLYRSIRKLMSLPDATRLFMCHDYKAPGRNVYAWETTVKEAREECARQGRRQRGYLRRHARSARRQIIGAAAAAAIHPGEHPRRQIPARSCQRRELSHHSGDVQEYRSGAELTERRPWHCRSTTRANSTPRRPKPPAF